MAKKKNIRLNKRQHRLVKNLVKGMDNASALTDAGYSAKHPRQSVHQALEGIRAKMPDVLDRHGFTDDALIDKYLRPLLSARITKVFAHKGKIKDRVQLSDNETRRQTLDMAFRLKGAYSPKTEEEARVTQQFTGPTVIVLDLPRPKRETQENNQ